MGNVGGRAAGLERPEDPPAAAENGDTMVFWECRPCKLKPGEYKLKFRREHEARHEAERRREQEARDREAEQRRAQAAAASSKKQKPWTPYKGYY